MLSITALLHTHNDALRLGRCLETLYPCDEIVIVDQRSTDTTIEVARDYGAGIVIAEPNTTPEHVFARVRSTQSVTGSNWILCLEPRESLSEALAGSLYEWKSKPVEAPAFSVLVREETSAGWISHPAPQTRLVPQDWKHWDARLPRQEASSVNLAGELLRFAFP
jgi:cellulose synthase/poly-beta-1,6-N-acetylglucosamine synthase-like glycosyltransferase